MTLPLFDRIPASGELRRNELGRLLTGRRLLILLDNVQDSQQVRPCCRRPGVA
jgi:hypothetical protein